MSRIKQVLAQYSQEAVDYQFDTAFFSRLVKAIEKVRELNSRELTSLAEPVKEIGRVITEFLGLPVECHISPSKDFNAWVRLPDFNKNHPFFALWQGWTSSKDGLKALGSKDYDIANVDRKTGHISGVYAKCECPITFTKALMTSPKFTSEEIAAVALHEIGHIFSMFETMYRTAGVNLAIASAMEDCVGLKDPNIRMKVVKGLKEKGVIDVTLDENALAQIDDEKLPVVVITSAYKKIRQDNDAVCYNRTAWEQSADQFAVRMGAGAPLATALSKLESASEAKRVYAMNSLIFFTFKFFTTSFRVLMLMAGTFIPVLIITLYELLLVDLPTALSVSHNTYDNPKDRIARIRREQIGKLKVLDKDNELVKETIEQIDLMKKIEDEQLGGQRSLQGDIYAFIYNAFTRQLSKKEQQQTVEKLMNNELFVQAAKFKLEGK